MAITIKLADSVFLTGGIFYGVDTNRAVLFVGTNRDGFYAGKLGTGTASNLSYRGGQNVLLISWVGTSISDITLETYMKNTDHRTAYGAPIIDYVERGIIEVYQNTTLLTPAALNVFTA